MHTNPCILIIENHVLNNNLFVNGFDVEHQDDLITIPVRIIN